MPGKLSRLQVTIYRSDGERLFAAPIVRSARARETRTRRRRIHNERLGDIRFLQLRGGSFDAQYQKDHFPSDAISFVSKGASVTVVKHAIAVTRKRNAGWNHILQHPDG